MEDKAKYKDMRELVRSAIDKGDQHKPFSFTGLNRTYLIDARSKNSHVIKSDGTQAKTLSNSKKKPRRNKKK